MKKSNAVLGLFAAGMLVASGAGASHAGDLKVTGFADIQYFITNDQPDLDGGITNKNLVENQFVVKGELDFEKEMENVTFRMDLDFPSNETGAADTDCTLTAAGTPVDANGDGVCDPSNTGGSLGSTLAATNMGVNGLPAGGNTFAEHIEQAKFVWAITGEEMGNIFLEGGIFNSPIGYESQDAPDRSFISYGQLFGMVPSNLGGIQLGGSHGPISASVIYVDEWRGTVGPATGVESFKLPTSEENSLGGTLGFNPMPEVGLSIGYLTSDQAFPAATPPTPADEDILDIILSGTAMPSPDLELSYGIEYLTDENNDAYAITVSARHGHHALSLRYDAMDCDATSASCAGLNAGGTRVANEPTSFTISASCDVAEALTARLEWSTYDADAATTGTGAATAKSLDADMLSLQFVANLM